MARFTIRVELHRATEDDYDQLHAAMEDQGFSRYVTSTDGITYHLPTAEYSIESDSSALSVLESAKSAAASTRRGYEVLVTKSAERRWYNLEKA